MPSSALRRIRSTRWCYSLHLSWDDLLWAWDWGSTTGRYERLYILGPLTLGRLR